MWTVARLVKYIDTYRDPRAENEGEEETDEAQKKPWWAFWRGGGVSRNLSDFVTPDDWVKTHINAGLDDAEVEKRRKRSGWNELTTEKENMFLKFIGFFRGPILYGGCSLTNIEKEMETLTTCSTT